MRGRFFLVVLVAACSSAPAKPPVIANTPVAKANCGEAATGLERATKSLRDPESTIFEAMRKRCEEDAWSVDAAVCFKAMGEGELGTCAHMLADGPRDAMFAVLAGGGDRTRIAVARVKLADLHVGVALCDQFVVEVTRVLGCEQMSVETRANLGTETADFWDLPTKGLSADAQARMATACETSLQSLQQQAAASGC